MKYSLMIGKFQPFGDENEAQVRALLKEGKNVCIAVQSTMRDKKNPYNTRLHRGLPARMTGFESPS